MSEKAEIDFDTLVSQVSKLDESKKAQLIQKMFLGDKTILSECIGCKKVIPDLNPIYAIRIFFSQDKNRVVYVNYSCSAQCYNDALIKWVEDTLRQQL